MERGDTVYDINGAELVFVAEVPGHGYLVQEVFNADGEEQIDGTPYVIDKVFESAPSRRIEEAAAEAQSKLNDLRRQIREASAEAMRLTQEHADRIAKLSAQNAALARIEQFLDGKITHYVVVGYGIAILSLEETRVKDDGYPRKTGMKLLTLFGTDGCGLEWRLNHYRDGSGVDQKCYPCQSCEEAKAKAQELVDAWVAEWRAKPTNKFRNAYNITRAHEAAEKYGLAFPDDISGELRGIVIATQRDAVAAAQKKLQEETEKLSQMQATTMGSQGG